MGLVLYHFKEGRAKTFISYMWQYNSWCSSEINTDVCRLNLIKKMKSLNSNVKQ